MTKESYYFSHDANARNDEKILMLRMEHGWEGYGLYWAMIEMMYESGDTSISHSAVKGIAFTNHVAITKLEDVINTCITQRLFVTDGNSFWSESLRNRKKKYQDTKEEIRRKRSEAGKKGMASRWGNKDESPETPAPPDPDNKPITNGNNVITSDITEITIKERKGKESKGKESEGKESEGQTARPLNDFAKIHRAYEQNLTHHIADRNRQKMNYWLSDYKDADLIVFATEWARDQNKKTESFVEYLLKTWQAENIKTPADAKKFEEDRQKKPLKKAAGTNWDEVD